jgi:hypothetical protein
MASRIVLLIAIIFYFVALNIGLCAIDLNGHTVNYESSEKTIFSSFSYTYIENIKDLPTEFYLVFVGIPLLLGGVIFASMVIPTINAGA